MVALDKLIIASVTLFSGVTLYASQETHLPDSFYVKSKNLKIRFDSMKAYNINGIEYKGKILGIDKKPSHYGTVLKFQGKGFIGSGHREVEAEKVVKLEAFSDEKQINMAEIKNDETIISPHFKLVRLSNIHGIDVRSIITIKADSIHEKIHMRSSREHKLVLMYNFMYPWSIKLSKYAAKTSTGEIIKGESKQAEKFYINKEIEWAAFYSPEMKCGVVLDLVSSWNGTKSIMRLWDRRVYNKFYLQSFSWQAFPANTDVSFQLNTIIFESEPDSWSEKASNIALKRKPQQQTKYLLKTQGKLNQ